MAAVAAVGAVGGAVVRKLRKLTSWRSESGEFLGSPSNVLPVAPELRPGLGKCFGVGDSRPTGSGRRRDDGFVSA